MHYWNFYFKQDLQTYQGEQTQKIRVLSWQLFKKSLRNVENTTAQKVSEYRAFSGPYFPVFGMNSSNTGKRGPEKTPNLDIFHVVYKITKI